MTTKKASTDSVTEPVTPPAPELAAEPESVNEGDAKEADDDHGNAVCVECRPVIRSEMVRAASIYGAVQLMTAYGDRWDCVWQALPDRRDAVIVLSLMAEQLCQEVAHLRKTSVAEEWGRLAADQLRDLPSLQAKAAEKVAPSVVRQAEKVAAAAR
ncbi:hypothetical protein [Streptomyces sp. NPDC059753]|uniref:hypothetical protein n=1 Tax=Streptomyces sp. NPDC059753 TaxID=3346933 RepID=UPI003650EEB8